MLFEDGKDDFEPSDEVSFGLDHLSEFKDASSEHLVAGLDVEVDDEVDGVPEVSFLGGHWGHLFGV